MKKDYNIKVRSGIICFAASLGGLLFGFDTAVISGALPFVQQQFSMNAVTEGWFVSSGLLGCIIGVLTAGLLSDKVGRKKMLLLAAILFLVSGIGCAWANSAGPLVVYRLIGGAGVGVASALSPMFITEFARASSRGRMVSFYQLAITLGILAAYFSNAWLLSLSKNIHTGNSLLQWLVATEVWRSMFLVMVVPSVLFILFLLQVPESPRWLISHHKQKEALAILLQVRNGDEAKKEFDAIRETTAGNSNTQGTLFTKKLRKPLLIGVLLAVLQQFSGINAIIYYGPRIFSEAGLGNQHALDAQVLIGLVNVLFTLVAVTQADRMGRKPLLIIGLSGMIVSLLVTGACFYTQSSNSVLLMTMLILFIACFALSVGPVTWILINEIFPNHVRVKGVAFCTLALWVSVWLVGQFFPWLLENVGPAAVFWIFAAFSTIHLLFSVKILVETKGKMLEEIETVIMGGH